MRYALIENGVVANIVEINHLRAADFPSAVSVEDYPVCVSDTYANNKFYHDGEEVLSYQKLKEIADALYDPDNIKIDPDADDYQNEMDAYKKALNLLGVQTDEEETDDEK